MPEEVQEWVIVYDRKDCTRKNNDEALLQNLLKVFREFYPERLGAIFIVNTSFGFRAGFKLAMRGINSRTREKVIFFQTQKHLEFKMTLIRYS